MLGRALPGLWGEAPGGGSMTVQRPSGRARLGLHVSPVGDAEADFGARRVAALVLVADPARRPSIDAQRVLNHLEHWLHARLPRLSAKTALAAAIRYALTRLQRHRPFLQFDNSVAERAMRPLALGRKNYLFMVALAGGKAASIAYTLIETAKMNGLDP